MAQSHPKLADAHERVRVKRLRRDAQRSMSRNLADGIALSNILLRFVGVARSRR